MGREALARGWTPVIVKSWAHCEEAARYRLTSRDQLPLCFFPGPSWAVGAGPPSVKGLCLPATLLFPELSWVKNRCQELPIGEGVEPETAPGDTHLQVTQSPGAVQGVRMGGGHSGPEGRTVAHRVCVVWRSLGKSPGQLLEPFTAPAFSQLGLLRAASTGGPGRLGAK